MLMSVFFVISAMQYPAGNELIRVRLGFIDTPEKAQALSKGNLLVLAQFASGAGNAFTVVGPAEGHDSALINAGINVQWTPRIGTYFGYNGQVGRSRYDSQGGVCSVHFDF